MQREKRGPARTPEQARAFAGYSIMNAASAEGDLHKAGCKAGCRAYEDIFTYGRWADMGYQVRRGEHGAHINVVINTETERDDGTIEAKKLFKGSTVFCRCQVDRKAGD